MNLPFTVEQFFQVFRDYNNAVWPMQIFLVLLAVIAILFLRRGRVVSGILSILWGWMGIVYHFAFFSTINPAARVFGSLFLIHSIIFLWFGVKQNVLQYQTERVIFKFVGILLIGYGLVMYPTLNYLLGHIFPANPTFGAPCPTVLFSVGVLLLLRAPFPKIVLLIPFVWCVIGATAAFLLQVPEDLGLIFAGFMSLLKATDGTQLFPLRAR